MSSEEPESKVEDETKTTAEEVVPAVDAGAAATESAESETTTTTTPAAAAETSTTTSPTPTDDAETTTAAATSEDGGGTEEEVANDTTPAAEEAETTAETTPAVEDDESSNEKVDAGDDVEKQEATADQTTEKEEEEAPTSSGGGVFSLFGLNLGKSERTPKNEEEAKKEGEKQKDDNSNDVETPKAEENETAAADNDDAGGKEGEEDAEKRDGEEKKGGFSLFGLSIGGGAVDGENKKEIDGVEAKAAEGDEKPNDNENKTNNEEGEPTTTKEGDEFKKKQSGFFGGMFGGSSKKEIKEEEQVVDEEKGEAGGTAAVGAGTAGVAATTAAIASGNDETTPEVQAEKNVDVVTPEPAVSKSAPPSKRSPLLKKYTMFGILCAAAVIVVVLILVPLLTSAEKAVVSLVKEGEGDNEKGPDGKRHHEHEALTAEMVKHPAYDGPLFPYGKITLRFDDDDRFLVVFRMEGLETTCTDCKWAIVNGTTCANAENLGTAPMYDTSVEFFKDGVTPYTGRAVYDAKDGLSFSTVAIWAGLDFETIQDHAIVVYQQNEQPLGCGILKHRGRPMMEKRLFADMRNYLPEYDTSRGTIEGDVRMEFFGDNSFRVQAHLEGLPPQCFACGIYILQGTDCSQPHAALGGHYFNSDKLKNDPWNVGNGVHYNSDANGTSHHSFYLYNGYSFDDHFKHVLVIYDQGNAPIGCGQLWSTVHHKEDKATAAKNAVKQYTDIAPSVKVRRAETTSVGGRRIVVYAGDGEAGDGVYQNAGEKIIIEQAAAGREATFPSNNGRVELIQV